ncbi:hypothetical protein AB9F41_38385, partial [Rhizobium leguminosarum]|uniref:hypothetical protein n=1 Tax=Rhizobium leguminosarum TaxID=384 RepID=UPI003F95A506
GGRVGRFGGSGRCCIAVGRGGDGEIGLFLSGLPLLRPATGRGGRDLIFGSRPVNVQPPVVQTPVIESSPGDRALLI